MNSRRSGSTIMFNKTTQVTAKAIAFIGANIVALCESVYTGGTNA